VAGCSEMIPPPPFARCEQHKLCGTR
jgi:hypothetical protein